jgi:ABC-type bacteriocin/lantibiotic exporter with double-glycine peptidase domain
MIMSGLYGLSGLGLLIYYSPLGGLAAAALFALLIGGAVVTGREQLRANKEGEALTANIASLTLQIIQNISTVRAFGAERRFFALWARNTAAVRARALRARMAQVRFDTFAVGYEGIANALAFAALGYTALKGGGDGYSAGTYLAFLAAYQGVLGSSNSFCHGIVAMFGLQPILERAGPILHEAPETSSDAIDPGPLTGNVELSHVTFRYSATGPAILKDATIRIEKGSMVALVGPSGGGKSTALSLILGFERPETGVVLFDGRELSKLDKSAVRRQIGVVRQNSRLVGGSIFENLIGMHSATLDEAWEAAELAGIADDIRALPMGMHTMIMEGVSTLSGGQVQRLLLARALICRPKLLILDEATSALDNKTQSLVVRNIERLGITRLVVAHRLSTVEQAHCIYFMREGSVREAGTFSELISGAGEFASFARRQII